MIRTIHIPLESHSSYYNGRYDHRRKEKNITATELLEETVTHFLKENKKLQPNCHPDPFVNSLQSLFRHIYHSIVYAWNPDPYSDIAYSLAVIII